MRCKCLKKLIKSIDIFGTIISFRINNEYEYKSFIGGILTLIFILLSFGYSFYFFYFFITRKEINFIYSTKVVENNPSINLQEVGFNFAFGIQKQGGGSLISETLKYFEYSIIMTIIEDTNIQNININYHYCSKSDFNNQLNHSFDICNLEGMLCPNWNNINYTVAGTYMDNYYKYITLNIKLSEYSINNINELTNFFQKNPIEMAIYFTDNAIHYENRENPMPIFLNYIFKSLDYNFHKSMEIILSLIEFKNDENVLFNNPKMRIGATFDNSVDSFHIVNDRNIEKEKLIGKMVIKTSPRVIQLSRTYQKLPNLIADLSGIIQEILMIIFFFINFIERQMINNKLINKMLKFKGNKYYDVNYLINVFKKDKINSDIMNIINQKKFDYKKNLNFNKGILQNDSNEILNNESNIKIKRNNFVNIDLKQIKSLKTNYESYNYKNEQKNSIIDGNKVLKINDKNKKSFDPIYSIPSISLTDDNNIINNDNNVFSTQRIKQTEENNIEKILSTSPNIILKNNIKLNNNDINENFYHISAICVIFSKVFFWCNKKIKKRNDFFTKAEKKIHYYLDIYNYIKKIQEIDLLIYCLFENDQSILFDFLSKAPIRIDNDKESIYNEFSKRQIPFKKMTKEDLDIIYNSYRNIVNKDELIFENLKLLRLVNAEVKYLN